MKTTLEELRESYYFAISKLDNEEDIRNSLPSTGYDNFEELIKMIMSKLEDEIAEWEHEDLIAATETDKELIKKELAILFLKKRICLEKFENKTSLPFKMLSMTSFSLISSTCAV